GTWCTRIVVGPQPADKIKYVDITPHPGGEMFEVRQGLDALDIVADPAHVAIDAVGLWPIRLDGHRGETLLLKKALGDLGALPIELVRTVRCRAKQDKASITDERGERIIVCGCAYERVVHGLELST